MKTFTATHLNKHAKDVFHAAKEDGSVVIEHYGYLGGVFAIVWNPDMAEDEMLKQITEAAEILDNAEVPTDNRMVK